MSGRNDYIPHAVPVLNLILIQLFLCTSVSIDLELDYEFQFFEMVIFMKSHDLENQIFMEVILITNNYGTSALTTNDSDSFHNGRDLTICGEYC